MPKVLSYTPGWLSRPSPGFQFFNTAQSTTSTAQDGRNVPIQHQSSDVRGNDYVGPNKIIARRGTEVFLVAGKQIRWTDLVSLKDGFEEQLRTPSKKPKATGDVGQKKKDGDGPEDGSYRILKVPVSEPIRQLSVSSNGSLLAIATSHTVQIVILPDSNHLGHIPNDPIRLKTYTVGPTVHVLSQSQVMSILWHPCGVGGNCLVTITADAVLRMWEFNRENRWSSDSPSLAVDLKKLVVGSCQEEDFAPEKFGKNRRFSVDNVGLEVASACFGGTGSSHESGWSAMTLWIAMKGGDVYALCPILPSKWQPSVTLIPSISAAAVVREASERKEDSPDSDEEREWRDQLDWIREIDSQDSVVLTPEDEYQSEVYTRPSHPGPIPRLQGPFQVFGEESEEDLELSDIHVIASRIDAEEFNDGEESGSEAESIEEQGLSATVVVLVTTIGRVFVCLNLEGVEGQWLPRRKPKHFPTLTKDPHLIVLEGLDTLSPTEQLDLHWPTVSHDVFSRYSFFITHNNGVFYFSFDPWVRNLEMELQSSERLGAQLRLEVIKDGPGTLRERIMSFGEDQESASVHSVSACLSFLDSDLGYFLLTSVDGHPEGATLDEPFPQEQRVSSLGEEQDEDSVPELNLLDLGPARTIYQPSDSFYAKSSLPRFLDTHVHYRHKRMMREEVRLSTATLDLMTQAHRVLSQETHGLGLAASDLFRRCDRLQDELRDQIRRIIEVANRTDKVTDDDADLYIQSIKSKQPPTINERLENVRNRQGELADRYQNLRKKFNSVGGRALSEKERLWVSEVDRAHNSIKSPPADREEEEAEEDLASELWHRHREVEELKEDLIARAKEVSEGDQQANDNDTNLIPDDLRRLKLAQVKKLLGTQTQMVEGARTRLQQLSKTAAT